MVSVGGGGAAATRWRLLLVFFLQYSAGKQPQDQLLEQGAGVAAVLVADFA